MNVVNNCFLCVVYSELFSVTFLINHYDVISVQFPPFSPKEPFISSDVRNKEYYTPAKSVPVSVTLKKLKVSLGTRCMN